MRKQVMALKPLMALIALIVVVFLVVNAFGGSGEAIAEARAEATRLVHERDSLIATVQERDREQSALIIQRESLETKAIDLRASVARLERQRAEAQRTTRQIRTVGELQDRLRAAFPELGGAAWGLTTVQVDPADTLGLEYLMVPAWFAETFAIDRANARSWETQRHQLLQTDSLRLFVSVLQDSITRLETANAAAYRTGYRSAYTSYQELNRLYVAELRKPRFEVKTPIGVLGALGLGLVVGRALP